MCAGSFGGEHPDREFERHAALEDELAHADARRDRLADYTPTPRPLEDGRALYESPGRMVAWDDVPDEMRAAWAAAERFLTYKMRRMVLPGALQTPDPATAVEEYEQRVDAVVAVVWDRLAGKLELARGADEAWVREIAQEFVAAADTGI